MPKSWLDAVKCLLGACVILAIVAIGSPALALTCTNSVCSTGSVAGFQSWSTPSETYTDMSTVGGTALAPYFNHDSFEASQVNIGYYITSTGAYLGGAALSSHQLNSTNGQAGPGSALNYWGNSNGTADQNFFFDNGGVPMVTTFKFGWSNFTGNNPLTNPSPDTHFNEFGWFQTDASGSSIGPLNPVFTANASITPGQTFTFTPTLDYGLYVKNDRGIFTTLSSLGTDNGGPTTGNTITPQPSDCGTTSSPCPPLALQHFAVFQQNPGTKWVGVEDLYNFGPGVNCGQPNASPTACIDRSKIDQDYNDVIISVAEVPAPGSMMLLGSGLAVGIGITLRRRVFRR